MRTEGPSATFRHIRFTLEKPEGVFVALHGLTASPLYAASPEVLLDIMLCIFPARVAEDIKADVIFGGCYTPEKHPRSDLAKETREEILRNMRTLQTLLEEMDAYEGPL